MNFSRFFIDRPIFAGVLSALICALMLADVPPSGAMTLSADVLNSAVVLAATVGATTFAIGLYRPEVFLKTRRLLGVHISGEGATELIHIWQAVLNLKGTLDYFIENTFNYPTLAEAYKIAALDAWNRMPK